MPPKNQPIKILVYRSDDRNIIEQEFLDKVFDTRIWRNELNENPIIIESDYFKPNNPYRIKLIQILKKSGKQNIIHSINSICCKNGNKYVEIYLSKSAEKEFQSNQQKHMYKIYVESIPDNEKFESLQFYRWKKITPERQNQQERFNNSFDTNDSGISSISSPQSSSILSYNSDDSDELLYATLSPPLSPEASMSKSSIQTDGTSAIIHLNTKNHQIIQTKFENVRETFTEIEFSNKNKKNEPNTECQSLQEKFHSFKLKITEKPEEDSIKLNDNIYLAKDDAKFSLNHALRALTDKYSVKYIASFKIDTTVYKKTDQILKNVKENVINLLDNGIEVTIGNENVKFLYFGHTNSGMKDGKFWAVDSSSVSKTILNSFIKELGDFQSLKNPEKLCKRYGQSFSSSISTISLEKDEYICIDDDCDPSGKYEFTDGIGLMRLSVAEDISKYLNLKGYVCKVFQIRCSGFKGVLAAMPDEIFEKVLQEKSRKNSSKVKVIFRKSQKKFDFDTSKSISLCIVNWVNKILEPADLNIEFLLILDGLTHGTSSLVKQNIVDIYQEYLKEIQESFKNPKKMLKKLVSLDELNDFSLKYLSILMSCGEKNSRVPLENHHFEEIRNFILEKTLAKTISKKKFFIEIEKSRYLMGIVDETGTLNENEVFVSYRDSNEQQHFLDQVPVIVSRTPCYGLSEIRRVMTRDIPQYHHLDNVIAFSKHGNRPLPDILSGGDLDGDLYFVSWDQNLTPIENAEPLMYPKAISNSQVEKVDTRTQIITTFVKSVFTETLTGLWHYYLVCKYDKSREIMAKEEYKKGVFIINQTIDGCLVEQKPPNSLPPAWHFTNRELKSFYECETNKERIEILKDLILKKLDTKKEYRSTKKLSLVGELMFLTMEKFIEFTNETQDGHLNNDFFSKNDLKILTQLKKIDLNLVKIDFKKPEFIQKIIDNYEEMINQIAKLNKQYQDKSKLPDLFVGQAEKYYKKEQKSKLSEEKCKLKANFKQFVFDLPYQLLSTYPNEIVELLSDDSGILAQSRIVQLYLSLKDTNHNEIPWEFYDNLCMLKNLISYENFSLVNDILCPNQPFSLPIQQVEKITKLLRNN